MNEKMTNEEILRQALEECHNQLTMLRHERNKKWSSERINMVSVALYHAENALKVTKAA